MKKLLALVLALVMTLSLAVVGSNAAFKDADQVNETYSEAVNVLSGMKVFQGYTDGSFQPTGDITRAEVAAIVYRLYTGDVADAQASLYATYNKFTDMSGAAWAAGYIGYCANAGLVKGYDAKTFGPANKVTGYEALAMILRAVGYDANGEFTGADWQLHVAQYAQQLGVLKNVKGVDLNAPATRELVAELLFRTAAEVPMVTYSAALGYTNLTTLINGTKNDTLGYKNFKLVATEGTTDDFGRPSRTWNYNTGDKKTVVAQVADATYTVKVDECDIAKDLGISTSAKIESGWIDGYKYPTAANTAVTTDANGKIDAQNTTSYVGGQGRLTEVYDMGTAGYRIVEINTYLAQVSKVTAASTDKNGHTIAATIDVNVFTAVGTTSTVTKTPVLGVKAEGFTKDQYVLVTMYREKLTDNYKVASVEAATLTAVGAQTGYTAARGTVAATSSFSAAKYDNADKFFLNQFSTVSNDAKKNWSVATDSYGNAIGLVEGATNYLVIEAARFDRTAGSLYGGSVIADVVLADGSRVSGVTIAQVGTKTANHASAAGVLANGSFSDDTATNNQYYDHLFAYSVDANGNYIIAAATDAFDKPTQNPSDTTTCSIYNKGTYIYNGSTVEAAVNDATVFVVADKGGVGTYTYTTYVGKDNVPSMTGAKICYVKTGAYASLVVVYAYNLASNTFDAYVAENTSTNRDWASGKYAFNVYKLGEETATTVLYSQSTLPLTYTDPMTQQTSSVALDGIYTITVNSDNEVTSAVLKLAYSTINDDTTSELVGQSGQTWNRVTVGSNDGTTLVQKGVTPENTYYVTGTPTIVVTYDTAGNLVSVAKAADSTAAIAGDSTFVGYRDRTVASGITYQDADYLYVFKTVNNASGNNATAATVNFQLNIMNGSNVEATYDLGYVEMTAGSATFTLTNASTQVDWNAGAPISKDARVTGLTLSGYANPVIGTQQAVTITADQYGSAQTVVFTLYR